jgi:hypothetical protein
MIPLPLSRPIVGPLGRRVLFVRHREMTCLAGRTIDETIGSGRFKVD